MNRKKTWKKEDVKNLFMLVEEHKLNNKPLMQAFKKFASSKGRKTTSVRNFYYNQLLKFEKSKPLQDEYKIDISNHTKINQKFFTADEEREVMESISKLHNQGYSIRKACLELSNGNLVEMTRLQNKYRNTLARQETLKSHQLNNSVAQNNNINIHPFRNNTQNNKHTFKNNEASNKTHTISFQNLTHMPKRKAYVIGDDEIKALFLGLVNIIRKNCMENAEETYNNRLNKANFELQRTIISLAKSEEEKETLLEKIKLEKTQNKKLKESIKTIRARAAELLAKDKSTTSKRKIDKLKSFFIDSDNNSQETTN